MKADTVIFALKIISYFSLSIVLFLTIMRNLPFFSGIIISATNASKNYAARQKELYEKNTRYIYKKRHGLMYRIDMKIARAGLIGWLNAKIMLVVSILLFIIAFTFIKNAVGSNIFAFYLSMFFFILPFLSVTVSGQINSVRIERYILYFIETLRNYVSADQSNLIIAYDMAKEHAKPRVLKKFVEMFVFEVKYVQRNFQDAVESHKEAVNIRTYSEFLDNVKACYTIGGNFAELLDQTTDKLNMLQKAKIKRVYRAIMVRIVMAFLIIINLLFFVYYYFNNYGYFIMVVRNPWLMSIIFTNFYIVLFMAYKAGQMDI